MKPQRIVVIGAGGMAREVASTLKYINQIEPRFEFVGYVVSDLSRLGDRDSREQVVGDFHWLDQHRSSIDAVAIGVGSPSVRFRLARELSSLLNGISWPALRASNRHHRFPESVQPRRGQLHRSRRGCDGERRPRTVRPL